MLLVRCFGRDVMGHEERRRGIVSRSRQTAEKVRGKAMVREKIEHMHIYQWHWRLHTTQPDVMVNSVARALHGRRRRFAEQTRSVTQMRYAFECRSPSLRHDAARLPLAESIRVNGQASSSATDPRALALNSHAVYTNRPELPMGEHSAFLMPSIF